MTSTRRFFLKALSSAAAVLALPRGATPCEADPVADPPSAPPVPEAAYIATVLAAWDFVNFWTVRTLRVYGTTLEEAYESARRLLDQRAVLRFRLYVESEADIVNRLPAEDSPLVYVPMPSFPLPEYIKIPGIPPNFLTGKVSPKTDAAVREYFSTLNRIPLDVDPL